MDTIGSLKAAAVAFGDEPLFTFPDGQVVKLSRGYIPLLVNYTLEDKAAKGLRKFKAAERLQSPVFFTALELVRDHKVLLLSGGSGSGKTSFAKHLSFRLANEGSIGPHLILRNYDGDVYEESWQVNGILPAYFTINSPEALRAIIDDTLPRLVGLLESEKEKNERTLLIILDTVERAGTQGQALLTELLAIVVEFDNIKLLVLGDTIAVKDWNLPSHLARHDLLPLLENERRQAMSTLTQLPSSEVVIGTGKAASTPIYFALALQASHRGDQAEGLLDAWLAVVAPNGKDSSRLAATAFFHLGGKSQPNDEVESPISTKSKGLNLIPSNIIQQLLAARHLLTLPSKAAIELFHENALKAEPILRSLLVRLDSVGDSINLVEGLIHGPRISAQLGALLVSDFIEVSSKFKEQILDHMLAIIESTLPVTQREKAGRVLSRLGDPRDLMALANVPGGNFILGSENHVNSQPLRSISLDSYRIGIYPIVNRDFTVFVRETGRDWLSLDGFSPERQNAPATDLTWYDAMAYCEWLTYRWQASGKIAPDEHVRLPSEPEWERAARGGIIQNDAGLIYPWGTGWQSDSANCEETVFNRTCSVGLFSQGRSPYGCYDMAGNVWEWCTTLWGTDMATPSFSYPWSNDGREALDAHDSIRRVLRGGCFSSGSLKITTTYRGSLEPAGFWRGNGFRIVVASVSS
ncbi:hypothetical protein G7Z17_g1346 [Cylindrodendrum hubeiense]|uniref:Uncharacterized protein n=1 Tax=Cylindrodendrum hubeiense TaxID=595255 RepID=A0A9P5HQC1_9HYPO|nr:hypothetical protein G7Z17_g1346 [Cylindrodendrum hubeiense]